MTRLTGALARVALLAAGVIALAVSGVSVMDRHAPASSRVAAVSTGRVYAVVDGDTVRVREGGRDLGRVRLLGVQAPEVARDGRPAECGADEATRALVGLVHQRDVVLRADPDEDDRDQHGRPLRYLEVDGRDVGEQLLRAGVARTYFPSRAKAAAYTTAQAATQAHPAGVWAACTLWHGVASPRGAGQPGDFLLEMRERVAGSRVQSTPDSRGRDGRRAGAAGGLGRVL